MSMCFTTVAMLNWMEREGSQFVGYTCTLRQLHSWNTDGKLHCMTLKSLRKWKYLIVANFWGIEHENYIKSWELTVVSKLLKGSHKNELQLSGWVELSSLRWYAAAFPITFAIPGDHLTL